jgi:choline dehydrogenase-like flavoprotein
MKKLNAANLPGELPVYDVCIVGSGAAAISMALRLSESPQLQILMLESSDPDRTYRNPDCRPLSAGVPLQAIERTDTCHRYLDDSVQPLYNGVVSPGVEACDETFLTRSRIRVYGGTTNCWGGFTRPLDKRDFTRSGFGGPWPITRDELDPFHIEAMWLCSLGDPSWLAFPPNVYDVDPAWLQNKMEVPVAVMKHVPESKVLTAVLSEIHREASPTEPKSDQGWDFQLRWEQALEKASNLTIVYNANVRRVITAGGRVTSVLANAGTTKGRDVEFRARNFVLAAGGVETVRLMQLSRLPDPSNKLGKGFRVHPLNNWPRPAATFKLGTDPVPDAVKNFYQYPWRHLATDHRRFPYNPALGAVLVPNDAFLTSETGSFRAMVHFPADKYDEGNVNINWEQKPDPANEIALSSTKLDVFDDPVVELRWSLQKSDWTTLENAVRWVGEELTRLNYASGYESKVSRTNFDILMGDHPMGATRMVATEKDGVVDKNCSVFGTPNLFIASSSVFPQTGWSNPTLTIIAMARRLAAHLAKL